MVGPCKKGGRLNILTFQWFGGVGGGLVCETYVDFF